ncbi:MAG: LVIVD repeat-containing protein [Actinomycetota bacterium]
MKRLMAAAILALMALSTVPTAGAGPSPGGISSDQVEWVKHVPFTGPSAAGGRLVGKYFYALDQNKLTIYDTTDPLDPQPVGFLPNPHEPIFTREDLDTNGKILLLPTYDLAPGPLQIVDVEDKTSPQVIAEIENGSEHTFSCVLDCKYAWGSEGTIYDLTDPSNPKEVGSWGEGKPTSNAHDVTEVAPGLVLTSTQPIMFLDARKNPTNPKLLALGASTDGRFIHTGVWPRKGKDKFLLMAGETNFKPRCNESNGAFMTWDASKWKKTHTFSMIDEYRMINGTYADGNPALNAVGCSSHWHENHPSFKNGGLVAAAFFEHGTRFIDVSSKGKIKEIGWFMPHAGSTGAVYWRTPEILYAVDYTRGIDILKYNGKL